MAHINQVENISMRVVRDGKFWVPPRLLNSNNIVRKGLRVIKKGIITWSLDFRMLYCRIDSENCRDNRPRTGVQLPEKNPDQGLVILLRKLGLSRFAFSEPVGCQRLKSRHPLRRAFSLVLTILNVRSSLITIGWIHAAGGQGLPSPKSISVYSLSKSQG